MKQIQISENIQGAKDEMYIVSEKEYKILEFLQYYGGFLRFNMAIYDNAQGKKSTFNCLKHGLSKVFCCNIDNILIKL